MIYLTVDGYDLSEYVRVQHDEGLDPVDSDRVTQQFAGNQAFAEGGQFVGESVGLREITVPLLLDAPSRTELTNLITEISNLLTRGVRVDFAPDSTHDATGFQLESGQLDPVYEHWIVAHNAVRAMLKLWVQPYGFIATPVDITLSGTGVQVFPATDVGGDTTTWSNLEMKTGSTLASGPRLLAYGVHEHPSYMPVRHAASIGGAMQGFALAGASGAIASQFLALTPGTAQAASVPLVRDYLTPPNVYEGRHRVFAVLRHGFSFASAVMLHAKDRAGVVLGPTAQATQLASNKWQLVDLGELSIEGRASGQEPVPTQYVDVFVGHSYASVMAAASPGISFNALLYLPLDVSPGMLVFDSDAIGGIPLYTGAAAAPAVEDNFNSSIATVLQGQLLSSGGGATWTTYGGIGTDWLASGMPAGAAIRLHASAAEVASGGRLALAPPVVAETRVSADLAGFYNSNIPTYPGVVGLDARASGFGNRLVAETTGNFAGAARGYFHVHLISNGATTQLASANWTAGVIPEPVTMGLNVETNGAWSLVLQMLGSPIATRATGSHALLASGGAMAQGQAGFHSHYISPTNSFVANHKVDNWVLQSAGVGAATPPQWISDTFGRFSSPVQTLASLPAADVGPATWSAYGGMLGLPLSGNGGAVAPLDAAGAVAPGATGHFAVASGALYQAIDTAVNFKLFGAAPSGVASGAVVELWNRTRQSANPEGVRAKVVIGPSANTSIALLSGASTLQASKSLGASAASAMYLGQTLNLYVSGSGAVAKAWLSTAVDFAATPLLEASHAELSASGWPGISARSGSPAASSYGPYLDNFVSTGPAIAYTAIKSAPRQSFRFESHPEQRTFFGNATQYLKSTDRYFRGDRPALIPIASGADPAAQTVVAFEGDVTDWRGNDVVDLHLRTWPRFRFLR